MVIFIAIAGFVIVCVEGSGVCLPFESVGLSRLILAGFVELIFEIAGVVKIYRQKPPKGD